MTRRLRLRHVIAATVVCAGTAIVPLLAQETTARAVAAGSATRQFETAPCRDECSITVWGNGGDPTYYCKPDGNWSCPLFPREESSW